MVEEIPIILTEVYSQKILMPLKFMDDQLTLQIQILNRAKEEVAEGILTPAGLAVEQGYLLGIACSFQLSFLQEGFYHQIMRTCQ
jgi:hypothetical protein